MINSLLALLVSIQFGHAAYYAEGVMQQVVAIRLAGWTAGPLTEDDVQGTIGFVATQDCGEIGQRVWLFHESEGWEGPYLVADCCTSVNGDCRRMVRRNIVVDVDFETAKRWGVLSSGPGGIDVAVIKWDALHRLWGESRQASSP